MNTARNSNTGTCDSACSTLRIGMRQKISAKIATVPRYGISLRQSGVVRAAGISSLMLREALLPRFPPARFRRAESRPPPSPSHLPLVVQQPRGSRLPEQQPVRHRVARLVFECEIEFSALAKRCGDRALGLDRLPDADRLVKLAPMLRVHSALPAFQVNGDEQCIVLPTPRRPRDRLAAFRVGTLFPTLGAPR